MAPQREAIRGRIRRRYRAERMAPTGDYPAPVAYPDGAPQRDPLAYQPPGTWWWAG